MERNLYLNKLIRKKHNGMIKVVTGLRRVGKTYLLFELFYEHLKSCGVDDAHIIKLSLDDFKNREYRNPNVLYHYVTSLIIDESPYYVLLDEVQFLESFEEILNSFLHIKNLDVYVTGSNAKFLSKDVVTEFRGRGDQITVYPLSFAEYIPYYKGDRYQAWQDYLVYGGLPKLMDIPDKEDKSQYLKNLFLETYMKDIVERNSVRSKEDLSELLDVVASNIGCLTNPKKLSDTFKSVKQKNVHVDTIKNFLEYFEDSFLIEEAKRYDVKGRSYIGTPMKFYFTDVGLRNARLNFRQIEETHLMENIIYNELRVRGMDVDVGVIKSSTVDDCGKRVQKQLEIDFVCNKGSKRFYIQSALYLPDQEKKEQETRPLMLIKDSFKKIIVNKDGPTHYDDNGVLITNIYDFLLNENSLDY